MKARFLFFLPLLFLASCATITRGVHEKLSVLSEPSGADVRLSSGEKGVTPAKFVKSRRDSFTVTISKPGFVAQTVKVQSKGSPTGGTAMAGNIVAGGIIGIAVDATSGAYNSLYPNPVSVHLAPGGKPKPAKPKTTARKSESAIRVPRKSPAPKRTPHAAPSPVPSKSPASEDDIPETTITPQTSPSPQ